MSEPAAEISDSKTRSDRIPLRMHPRIFSALGADLVTNDVVAVIELVKNSYDAFAHRVHVRFLNCATNGAFLEILDDGHGMTREAIENAWCVVATPYKAEQTIARGERETRRVAGEKGLGRLSAARLGSRLRMLTKAVDDICWELEIDWSKVSRGNDISNSFVTCKPSHEYESFLQSETGTRICIYDLKENWSGKKIADLQNSLARLLSPFSEINDFNIHLTTHDKSQPIEIEIEASEFLSSPKYKISGFVDNAGNVRANYRFAPITGETVREKALSLSWARISQSLRKSQQLQFTEDKAQCGSFNFEIRAWDIASGDTTEIAERFSIKKNLVRKFIKAHQGISVYRDNILVLPKSDSARDWLGLDLRRVSRLGKRLSTSQIVGYVSISSDGNPNIEDTSDRERFVSCIEVVEFQEILKNVIELFETERDRDRNYAERSRPMEDLFKGLDATELVADIEALSKAGADAAEAVSPVREYSAALASSQSAIRKRFAYYSHLATIGTISHMLIHEIRNRTMVIGSLLNYIERRVDLLNDGELRKRFTRACESVEALERLADNFSPLANRNFKTGKRDSVLEERIETCIQLSKGNTGSRHVRWNVPSSKTHVAVDPGELDSILLNLIANALYWLVDVPVDRQEIHFDVSTKEHSNRVLVNVRDTGPGVDADDIEKVFWPGITRKPQGIGMGLTVASELVEAYGGRMGLESECEHGASFVFDLPLSRAS